jgi:cytochrome b subunit of formate dehydrogenase
MEFLTWGRNPWGQQVLTHISWDLLWASLLAGIMFLVAHASYMVLSAHRKRSAEEMAAIEAANKGLPEKIERHTFMARAFHWVMAASMFVLLFTAFLPIAGFRFPWVTWHWVAGLVLTASIIYHIVHATFFLDFWSIWVGPKDIPEFKSELMLELGKEVPGYRSGKYPLGNKLYHLAIVVVGFAAVITGLMMMPRISTPFFTRNPYILTDNTAGITYVLHGLAGVGLVGLVIAHVYFAVRPDKWWITKGMIFGWIPRRLYLEHHDPQRWKVQSDKAHPASRA